MDHHSSEDGIGVIDAWHRQAEVLNTWYEQFGAQAK